MLKRYSFWEGLDCARCTFSRLLVVERLLYVRAASAQSAVGTPVHRSASSSPFVVCCQALFDLLVLDVCLVTGAGKEAGLGKVL